MKVKEKINRNKLDTLLKNKNFLNNQNYIFEKKRNYIEWKVSKIMPIYKYSFIEYLNWFLNWYIIDNYILYSFFRIIIIFYRKIDLYKIKWRFWQINNIYIKEHINIKKEIQKWDDDNLLKIIWINDKFIIDNFALWKKYIETEYIIYEIEYFDHLNEIIFLNYIWLPRVHYKYNLFNKKVDYSSIILIISFFSILIILSEIIKIFL